MTKTTQLLPASACEKAAWLIAACALIFVLKYSLLPALLSGLLVFELVHMITRKFPSKKPSNRSKLWAVGILVVIIVSLLALVGVGLVAFFRSDAGSLTMLLAKMAQILEDSRKILPAWMVEHLPADAITFKVQAAAWLRTHADELQVVGKEAGRLTAHIIIGMIIGGILAVREAVAIDNFKPFARALSCRGDLFSDAFRRVVFAQLRIAAINTTFTAIYLSQSLGVAIASLAYLIIIHKFEYFLNARIVGSQIRANAWELLIAMLCMEAAFGLAGIVAAPIYYAYIKSELRARNLV